MGGPPSPDAALSHLYPMVPTGAWVIVLGGASVRWGPGTSSRSTEALRLILALLGHVGLRLVYHVHSAALFLFYCVFWSVLEPSIPFHALGFLYVCIQQIFIENLLCAR